jgi:hypothetical protein
MSFKNATYPGQGFLEHAFYYGFFISFFPDLLAQLECF